MSTTPISSQVRFALVARAGGRCEFKNCNKRIDEDELTRRLSKTGVYAHIVADKPDGPRGDPIRSRQLADKIENLMLLCRTCHERIDGREWARYPETLLLEYKRDHEERVERLLCIDGANRTHVLRFTAPVGTRPVHIARTDAYDAVLPVCPSGQDVHIDMTNWAVRDDDPSYWQGMAAELSRRVRHHLVDAPNPDCQPWSVFGIAPIPLLMLLGRDVGDIASVRVFQKHRIPDTWKWQPTAGCGPHFTVERPLAQQTSPDVLLVLSVSGRIAPSVIPPTLTAAPRWELLARNPDVQFVRAEQQRDEFGVLVRQVIEDIKSSHGPGVRVHVLPAVPVSLAIEFGRRLLPKTDPAILVYDSHRANGGMAFALELLAPAAQP